jgi:hypothetical protein
MPSFSENKQQKRLYMSRKYHFMGVFDQLSSVIFHGEVMDVLLLGHVKKPIQQGRGRIFQAFYRAWLGGCSWTGLVLL